MVATLTSTKFAVLMAKNSMVYKGILFEDSFEKYLSRESTSICKLLYFLCIDDIAKHVERTFSTNKSWHFKYHISSMIKLSVVKCFRKLSYDKTISLLTDEDAILLSFLMKTVRLNFLAVEPFITLWSIGLERLREKEINKIMMLLGEKILELSS
jgi:hypothetical protein